MVEEDRFEDVEWDAAKARRNLLKHGVGFDEGATALTDPAAITKPDLRHAQREDREFMIGQSGDGRIVAIAYVARGSKIRIISVRVATATERNDYRQGF